MAAHNSRWKIELTFFHFPNTVHKIPPLQVRILQDLLWKYFRRSLPSLALWRRSWWRRRLTKKASITTSSCQTCQSLRRSCQSLSSRHRRHLSPLRLHRLHPRSLPRAWRRSESRPAAGAASKSLSSSASSSSSACWSPSWPRPVAAKQRLVGFLGPILSRAILAALPCILYFGFPDRPRLICLIKIYFPECLDTELVGLAGLHKTWLQSLLIFYGNYAASRFEPRMDGLEALTQPLSYLQLKHLAPSGAN